MLIIVGQPTTTTAPTTSLLSTADNVITTKEARYVCDRLY